MTNIEMNELIAVPGSPHKSVSIYYDKRRHLLWMLRWVLLALIFYVALFFSAADRNKSFAIFIGFVFFGMGYLFCRSELRNISLYSEWSDGNKPYIKMDREAITLLGDARLPWSSITFVKIKVIKKMRDHWTAIILGISDELQNDLHSIARHEELMADNRAISDALRREGKVNYGEHSFLALRLAGPHYSSPGNYLNMPSEKITALVEMYWRLAAKF
jgi:hypothetical protein